MSWGRPLTPHYRPPAQPSSDRHQTSPERHQKHVRPPQAAPDDFPRHRGVSRGTHGRSRRHQTTPDRPRETTITNSSAVTPDKRTAGNGPLAHPICSNMLRGADGIFQRWLAGNLQAAPPQCLCLYPTEVTSTGPEATAAAG